jgi:hypothetical protein
MWTDKAEIERVTQKYPNTQCEEVVPPEVKELKGFSDEKGINFPTWKAPGL